MTTMNIGSSTGTTGNGTGNVLGTSGGKFGDNPFLKLLTEQLKSQTPLDPVDNQSFMTQMASYSSMQQQQDLNTNMMKLLDYQGLLARLQGLSEGSALLGKEVTYDTDTQQNLKGTVQSVYINEQGDVRVKLGNGSDLGMRQITAIGNGSGTPTAASS